MITTVQKLSLAPNRRLLAISDIHGHPGLLRALLQKIGFSTQDILFIVGDIIEKGPDSLGALRLVMQLCRTHTVYPLIGNVDLWQLSWLQCDDEETAGYLLERIAQAASRYGCCLFSQMCAEAGLTVATTQDVLAARRMIRKRFAPEIAFLQGLPTIVCTEHAVFVHGGIPTQDVDSLAGTEAHPYLKNDNFMQKGLCFERWLVVGHWPATLYSERFPCCNPYISERQRIISIDGGCGIKRDGQLNALIFADAACREISYVACDELPSGIALDAQAESPDSFYLRYTDCSVRVLAREGDCVQVEHITTGRRLWAPSSFLYDEERRCVDLTDYRLPVSPGESLSLIQRTSRGYIAKKDGVTGWYLGRMKG